MQKQSHLLSHFFQRVVMFERKVQWITSLVKKLSAEIEKKEKNLQWNYLDSVPISKNKTMFKIFFCIQFQKGSKIVKCGNITLFHKIAFVDPCKDFLGKIRSYKVVITWSETFQQKSHKKSRWQRASRYKFVGCNSILPPIVWGNEARIAGKTLRAYLIFS